MTQRRRPSFIRRFFGFLLFRLVPLALIAAILWTGYGVVQAVARRVTEQVEASQRREIYPQTVTAIAATLTTHTPTSTSTPTDTATLAATPTSTLTPTLTPTPTVTPSETSTSTPQALAQVFVTNTPRAMPVTLPPLNTRPAGAGTTLTETPTLTLTPPPAATATLPPTLPAQPTATRPLPTVMFLGDPDEGQVDVTAIPTRVEPLNRNGNDLLNILLMGSDGEITNDGFKRTDTLIVLSVNRTTNTVAMLSLPRDLFVYIPEWGMQRINLAYARGQSGGWADGTFELLRQMLLYNFGINVHYYALIDLTGFKEIIDTIGGVDVAVDCAIEDLPLIGAEVPAAARESTQEYYYVLDVGYYHLNGAEALWYARSRYNSTDFDRGRRQQQILRAIWRKARDTGQLANLPNLWTQGTRLVETNLGFEDMLGLLPIALNLNPSLIENFALVRTYHTTPWQTPDGDYVQLPVYDTLRPLLEDFYQPPTNSQIVVEGARIRVFNGTPNADWDRVAAERLAWDGLLATAAGAAERTDYTDTVLIDYVGGSKGSSRGEIARILNVKPENIVISPDPNREVDFDVILGSTYNSCTFAVLPVGQAAGEG